MNMMGKKMPWQLATAGSTRFNDSLNWLIGSTQDAEDAALIVRAVNSHDKLVKALESALNILVQLLEQGQQVQIELKEAREALAAAKGE